MFEYLLGNLLLHPCPHQPAAVSENEFLLRVSAVRLYGGFSLGQGIVELLYPGDRVVARFPRYVPDEPAERETLILGYLEKRENAYL